MDLGVGGHNGEVVCPVGLGGEGLANLLGKVFHEPGLLTEAELGEFGLDFAGGGGEVHGGVRVGGDYRGFVVGGFG